MLGKRSAQQGMFEADTLYGEFVGRRTFYGYLASQRYELFRDADFAELYCQDNGRPSVPPSLLATALVLQTYDGVSDDEATRRAAFDLQWKVALGVEVNVRPFAKSTLQEFRAQLIVHDQTRAIFQRSLEMAKRRGVWKKGQAPQERQHIKLALDTTYILGRGAVKDSYNMLADGIVQVLRALAKLGPYELLELAEELGCTRYVSGSSLKGQAEVDWTNPKARQRFLAEIVADAEQLLELVRGMRAGLVPGSDQEKELVAAAEPLARILAQDIERDEHGPRLKRGVAPDRLISVHDPEMRHGRKSSSHRFNGHKTQVAVDTDTQLITAVEVLPGNAPDAEQALAVVEASEAATGCQVVEVLGDCAYGAGETRAEFAAAGRTLIAKVPDLQNQGYFAKTDFQLDLQAGTCTCPNHARHVTFEWRRVAVACSCLTPRPVPRVHCAPSARAVRADGRYRSTRKKPCSSKPATCKRVPRLLRFDGAARWSSTASRAWSSWTFVRRAISGGPRRCFRYAWQPRSPT